MAEEETPRTKLVSISEYADKYDLNRQTVYRLIKDGDLTVYDCEHCSLPHVDPNIEPVGVRKFEDREEYPDSEN